MNPSNIAAGFAFSNSQNVNPNNGALCRLADLMEFFFIAHPDSGRKEGEESKRILYFDSKNETLDKQTQITGFAEAVINFTSNFVNDEEESEDEFPFRFVNTSKQLHVYILVESETFVIGIAMNKNLCSIRDYTLHAPTIKSIIITAYYMFRLFFGSFSKLFSVDKQQLKDRLKYFFCRYLSLLRVYQMPLVDLFRGVDFLPLDSVNYLRVENLIDRLTERFTQIAKTMFLYQERLLSYSVPKSDLPVLFQYLTQNLLHMSLRAELQPEQQLDRNDSSPHHHGRFLTGATELSVENMLASASNVKFPVVYLSEDEEGEGLIPYHLVVYRALNATICLFLHRDAEASFLRDLDAVLGSELSSIASHIGDSYVALPSGLSSETDFHYIYYNPASLSLKTSFYEPTGETTKTSGPSPLPVNVYKLACDMVDEFLENEQFGEVTVKSEPDWWIFGKKTNERLLLLLLRNPSFASLADVQQHIQSVIKTNFDSIFLT